MIYRVIMVPQVRGDVSIILEWLTRHSPAGAATWYERWLTVLKQLQQAPEQYPLAPENDDGRVELRNLIFKTRRGREYRVLFTIQHETVVVLHLRGPGQDLLAPDEIRDPVE